MVDIWRLSRPDLAPPKNKLPQNGEAESVISSEDESDSYYDSDTEDSYSDENVSIDDTKAKKPLAINKDLKNIDPNRRRAMSEAIRPNFQTIDGSSNIGKASSKVPTEGTAKETETKPQLHEKTDCECGDHYPNVVFDQTYGGTLEKFYDLLYKNEFMTKFLTENQKTTGKKQKVYL
jgi:hypothetical protein